MFLKKNLIVRKNNGKYVFQFNVIGLMYLISPSQTKLSHLPLLLLKGKRATSFEDLRAVNNKICYTFHGSCLELGRIEDNGEWERAMTEGEIWMMP